MTLAYEDGTSTIDWASEVSEGPAAPWIAPVSNRQDEVRGSSLGRAGRHADLVQILFVDRTVGAALHIFRLSSVGLSGVSRRDPARHGPRHDGATACRFGVRDRRVSGTRGRRDPAGTARLRPGRGVPSPSADHVAFGTGRDRRRSGDRRDLTERTPPFTEWA